MLNRILCRRHARGFTLVEILVVICVMAVLMSMMIAAISAVKKGANRSKTMATIKTLYTAIEAYKAEWGYYPVPRADGFMSATTGTPATGVQYIIGPEMRKYLIFNRDPKNGDIATATGYDFNLVDAWGTPFAYVKTEDMANYRIASATNAATVSAEPSYIYHTSAASRAQTHAMMIYSYGTDAAMTVNASYYWNGTPDKEYTAPATNATNVNNLWYRP